MSQIPLSANIMSALELANETYDKARADNGSPQRPPKGEWDNIIQDIEIETEGQTFQRTKADKDDVVPAMLIRVTYAILGEPSAVPPDFKKGMEWIGKSFFIPLCPMSKLEGFNAADPDRSKGRAAMARMESARLKGLISAVLGDNASGNLQVDLQALFNAVKDQTKPVIVRVSCIYEQAEGKPDVVYFKDKISKRLG